VAVYTWSSLPELVPAAAVVAALVPEQVLVLVPAVAAQVREPVPSILEFAVLNVHGWYFPGRHRPSTNPAYAPRSFLRTS